MLRVNSLIYTAIFLILTTATGFSFWGDTQKDPIAISVTEAANADNISNNDLATWYSIYRGTYLYGTKFDFEKLKDFGVVFDKQRVVRDTLVPSKTDKLGITINGIFKKYEGDDPNTTEIEPEIPFDDNSKSRFLEECNSVAEGLKNAID